MVVVGNSGSLRSERWVSARTGSGALAIEVTVGQAGEPRLHRFLVDPAVGLPRSTMGWL